MWPFKKHKQIELLDMSNSKWSVLQSTNTTAPLLVRINDSALEWAKHPKLFVRVGFAIPLTAENRDVLPAENLVLNSIEDRLCELFKFACQSIHVITITEKTFKEFVFYIDNPEVIESVHKQLVSEFSAHEIQCFAEHDSDWQVYFHFKGDK